MKQDKLHQKEPKNLIKVLSRYEEKVLYFWCLHIVFFCVVVYNTLFPWINSSHTSSVVLVYLIEYYPALKKKVFLSFVTMWINLESDILSEINQTKTNNVWSLLYVDNNNNKKIELIETKQKSGCQGIEGGRNGLSLVKQYRLLNFNMSKV